MPQFRGEWKERQLPEGAALGLTPNQGSQGTKLEEGKMGKSLPRKAWEWEDGGEGAPRSEREERQSFQKP